MLTIELKVKKEMSYERILPFVIIASINFIVIILGG